MAGETSKKSGAVHNILRKRWFWVVVGLAALFVIILVSMPIGINQSLRELIRQNGGDEAYIEDINFNPFTGKLELTGLSVKVEDDQVMQISHAVLDVIYIPFIKKQIQVQTLAVSGLDILIEALPKGRFRLGGVTAALLSDSEGESKDNPWQFGLQELSIESSLVRFRSVEFQSTLEIDRFAIERAFSWMPKNVTRGELAGRLNGSPLKAEWEVTPFAADREASGKIEVSNLELKPFEKLAANFISEMDGKLTFNTDLQISQAADFSLVVHHRGDFSLTQLQLTAPEWQTRCDDFSWNGDLDLETQRTGNVLNFSADGELTGEALDVEFPQKGITGKQNTLSWLGKMNYSQQEGASRLEMDGSLKLKDFLAELPEQTKIQHSALNYEGELQLDQSADSTGVEVDGKLDINQLRAGMEQDTFEEELLSWEGTVQVSLPSTGSGLTVKTDGHLESKEFTADLPQDQLTLQQSDAGWKGEMDLRQTQDSLQVTADGVLNTGPLQIDLPGSKFQGGHQGIAFSGTTAYNRQAGAAAVAELKGTLDIDTLKMDSPDAVVAEKELNWDGTVRVSLPQEGHPLGLALDGKLDAGLLAMQLPQNKLDIGQEHLGWQGELIFGSLIETGGTQPVSSIVVKNLRIHDIERKYLLWHSKEVTAKDIKVGPADTISGLKFQIEDMSALQPSGSANSSKTSKPLMTTAGIEIADFNISTQGDVLAGSITIDTLKTSIEREKDGQWNFDSGTAALTQATGGETKDVAQKKAADQPATAIPQIKIDTIMVGGDSEIIFIDKSVDPVFNTAFRIEHLKITNLDSTKSDQKSPFELAGTIDKYTKVKFDGNLQPFMDRLSMGVDGTIKGLEMTELSSYTMDATGYRFASGEADIEIGLAINLGKLDGESRFEINKLTLDPLDETELQKRNITRTIPLDSAMSLLKDGKGNMKLKIPITGDIDDPKFSLGDAINQAVLKAARTATLSYLKFALWPYGTAIAAVELAMMAADKVNGIRLDPMIFDPGSAELSDENREYAGKLAGILKERPDARVMLCGIAADPADRNSLQQKVQAATTPKNTGAKQAGGKDKKKKNTEQVEKPPPVTQQDLEALARERADRVEQILVNEHGLDAGRLIDCHPQVDTAADAGPRVDLVF